MNNQPKFDIKKYMSAGATAFLVIVFSIVVFFAMFRLDAISSFLKTVFTILQPIVFGLVIAYVLNPVVRFFERNLEKLTKKKKVKSLAKKKAVIRKTSIFLSIILTVAVLAVLLNMIIPELVQSITKLVVELPERFQYVADYFAKIEGGSSHFSSTVEGLIIKAIDSLQVWFNDNFASKANEWIGMFAISIKNVASVILNIVIGVIISVYLLSDKEGFIGKSKKLIYAVFGTKKANIIVDTIRRSHNIFSGFIIGKVIDSAIIGVLCFILMSIFRLPYALIVSVLVGVTNIIPFFGPFIGAIPSAILILITSPLQGLYFVILIIVLQQLDGNIIGPKILSQSTGLSPFWVVFAILLGGGLFGFVGMLIGVPTFAVIYDIITRIINAVLVKNVLPVNSGEYTDIKNISVSGEVSYLTENKNE